jgi:hypothetical protein
VTALASNWRRIRRVLVTTGQVLVVLVILYGLYVVYYPNLYLLLNGSGGGTLTTSPPVRFPLPVPWPLQPSPPHRLLPVNK